MPPEIWWWLAARPAKSAQISLLSDYLIGGAKVVGRVHLAQKVHNTGSKLSANAYTSEISNWRSILTLVVFTATNIIVIFPFYIPLYLPRRLRDSTLHVLSSLRILKLRKLDSESSGDDCGQGIKSTFVRFNFSVNFITAPLIANLFLLAILAIGREEVYEGIIGADNIAPYYIVLVFLCLGYIGLSMQASGLVRWLSFKVLQKANRAGHWLYFYLYVTFFGLGILIGNDPIMVIFLAYMTRIARNIMHPRAWIHMQFAIANIATAILVSSNPTNLVLAGAFNIKFINYTANLIVPVLVTMIGLFPFLLFFIFADNGLIPGRITIFQLPTGSRERDPVNPHIPDDRGAERAGVIRGTENNESSKSLSLEEIMNPFLDPRSAFLGVFVMIATVVILLTLNAVYLSGGGHPDYWTALPGAMIMLCWNILYGWVRRHETRAIALAARKEFLLKRLLMVEAGKSKEEDIAKRERLGREKEKERTKKEASQRDLAPGQNVEIYSTAQANSTANRLQKPIYSDSGTDDRTDSEDDKRSTSDGADASAPPKSLPSTSIPPSLTLVVFLPQNIECRPAVRNFPPELLCHASTQEDNQLQKIGPVLKQIGKTQGRGTSEYPKVVPIVSADSSSLPKEETVEKPALGHVAYGVDDKHSSSPRQSEHAPSTIESIIAVAYAWCQETFPTAMAVFSQLPYTLIPFTLSMFVLVQALANTGWIHVFARGWASWVDRTGAVGSIGGMGVLSVVLCNFAGTNIGASILLSQIILTWQDIQSTKGIPISDREFWGTVYSMAIGVNYGAFSMAFSGSLAGIMWRDALHEGRIHVRRLDFFRVNLPISTIAMAFACATLTVEVYACRTDAPYNT